MSAKQTVTINGKQYDAHTGLLIAAVPTPVTTEATPAKPVAHSSSVHASTQKSLTLKRSIVKKKAIAPKRTIGRSNDIIRSRQSIAKSAHITRFAPHPVTSSPSSASPDIAHMKHLSLVKAHSVQAHAKMRATAQHIAPKPSHVVKQEIIADALAASSTKTGKTKRSLKKRFPRIFSVASASLAVLILGGYVTYLNMPTISVRVAAAQAGINASYPDYKPDGYRLSGPVAYSEGEVSMRFAATAGPQYYTVKQSKSSWDSSAVLENRVKPKTDGQYVTYNENGLTIYTYDGNAAWVNGGILYTIEGDASLSSEQIRHIATSL